MTQFSPTPRRLQSRARGRAAPASAAQACRVACLAVAGLAAGCQDRGDAAAADTAALVVACVDAMLRSSCRVMNGPEASTTASVVFVAGIGPVDAEAYRRLRSSGEAMCSAIETACRSDWDGTQCKTARSLWPAAAAAPPSAASGPR